MSAPTPRSFQAILGGMIDRFRSRTGVRSLRVGSPILTFLEAAAQSDTRAAQDIFTMLNSTTSLDLASGEALDAWGEKEEVYRRGAVPASGYVVFEDSSFEKISSSIYTGTPAPVAGTKSINIVSGANFPSSGKIYIGRGTAFVEGPLEFTAIENRGSYWTITLATPTVRFHGVGEAVVLAQGGDRTIRTSTVVGTVGSPATAVMFETTEDATIEDGEVLSGPVHVVCKVPGAVGNVEKDSITSIPSPPFVGARVTNPLPFTSGAEIESEESFRQRIRDAAQTKEGGTSLAIKNKSIGVFSPIESKRVVSASVVSQKGWPSTLYIDDGSGYEELTLGKGHEVLADYALGGEYLFRLSRRPIAKPHLESSVAGPWNITPGSKLHVSVDGKAAVHSFTPSAFRDMRSATAFEVVASINADIALPFSARTAEGGRRVVLFPKAPSEGSLKVLPIEADANDVFGFPTYEAKDIRLYKNDRLLYKDGKVASIASTPPSNWSFSDPSIRISVDGTGFQTYTFSDGDFDGYPPSPLTPPAEWATAFNRKIPGIIASVVGNELVLTSARGASDRASIEIDKTVGLGQGMFSVYFAEGRGSDYTLDRNTGELALMEPLQEGDILTAGTETSSAYIESQASFPVEFAQAASFFFVLDDQNVEVNNLSFPPLSDVEIVSDPDGLFITFPSAVDSVVEAGDWIVLWDSAFETPVAWRVSHKTSSDNVVAVYPALETPPNLGVTTLQQNGISVVKTSSAVIQATVPAGLYDLYTLAEELTLEGGEVDVWENESILVSTNTLGERGSIALVAANSEAAKLRLPTWVGKAEESSLAFVESDSDVGTPSFALVSASSSSPTYLPSSSPTLPLTGGSYASFIGGVNAGTSLLLTDVPTRLLRHTASSGGVREGDQFYASSSLAIGPEDTLQVSIDGETVESPLYRPVRSSSPLYGRSFTVEELDGTPLSETFPSFDFTDFAVHFRARGITHPATSKAMLWRFGRFGAEGNSVSVGYGLPKRPSAPLEMEVSEDRILINLPSTPKKPITIPPNAKFEVTTVTKSNHKEVTLSNLSVPIAEISRTGSVVKVTTTKEIPRAIFDSGDTVWVDVDHAAFPAGPKVVTSRGTPFNSNLFFYAEPGTDVPDTPVTNSSVQFTSSLPNFSSVAVGDLVSIVSRGFGSSGGALTGVYRVIAKTANSVTVTAPTSVSPFYMGTYEMQFYGVDTSASSVKQIADWSATQQLLNGTPLGDENEIISQSSFDDFVAGAPSEWTPLSDGVNWIQNLDTGTGEITLKDNISSVLAGDSDFLQEEMRLTPITADGVARFLAAPAVGGMSLRAGTTSTPRGTVQITSKTPGGAGRVRVVGGTANRALCSVLQPATRSAGRLVVSVPTEETGGFHGDVWVDVLNQMPIQTPISDGSTMFVTITPGSSESTITFSGVLSFEAFGGLDVDQVTPIRGFSRLSGGLRPADAEGGWVVSLRNSSNSSNNGFFRIMQVEEDGSGSWIWNPAAVAENGPSIADYFGPTAPMPGDLLSVTSDVWGEANIGNWTVKDLTVNPDNSVSITVQGQMAPLAEEASTYGIIIRQRLPLHLIKRLRSIMPAEDDTKLIFDDTAGYRYIGPTYGTIISVRDKLGFDYDTHRGLDGYFYSSGLIGEVSRVLYGDERDPHTYPGVVASSHSLNISGPLTRRVYLSLQVRLKSSASLQDTVRGVQSAVAQEVNRRGVGESIPLNNIVSAAERVPGVKTVVVLQPNYNASSDILVIQPHEKALVFDAERDISVRVVGK